jgi:hypothetical protein
VRIGFLLILAGRAVEAATVPPAWALTQFTAIAPYGAELPGWAGYWALVLGLAWPAGGGPGRAGGWRPWAILIGAVAQAAPLWPIALAEVANGSTAELVGLTARVRLPGLILLALTVAAILARAAARERVPTPDEPERPARAPAADDLGWTPALAWSAAIMTAGMLVFVVIPLADPANYATGGRRAARDLEPGSLREEGRSLYIREGCVLCHSQRLRAGLDGAHLGPSTRAADYADGPALAGLRRAGPDLAWAGDRFEDPEVLAERLAVHAAGGRPGFPWLFEEAGPSPSGASVVDYLIGLRADGGGARDVGP